MGLHLVVAHETASSPELREALRERAAFEAQAEFVLLVPATPTRLLLLPRQGKAQQAAAGIARSAAAQLQQGGLRVVRSVVGDADPLKAIAGELAAEPAYASIILSTHPADASRWLRAGVPAKALRFGLPVTHVLVESVARSLRQEIRLPPP